MRVTVDNNDERDEYERNEDENRGGEDSAQLTPTNSHLLALNTLLTTILKAIPIETIVIDYFYKSGYLVAQLLFATLFHNYISYSLIVINLIRYLVLNLIELK